MTGALVGPLPAIRFWDGTSVAYVPPRDTMDPRYEACTEHHPACDCREAELAEQLREYRLSWQQTQAAFETILAGHPTTPDDDEPGCQCTGCQIARLAHVFVCTQWGMQ